MKRSELEVGMEVETAHETLVIVDTRPWHQPAGYNTLPRPSLEGRSGSGVAAAELVRYSGGDLAYWWPRVVQLSQLRPAGTRQQLYEARLEQRRAAESEQQRRVSYFQRRALDLAGVLGLEPDDVEHRGTSVVIKAAAVDRLLAR